MAGINPQHVYLPTPDQSLTTGAIATAAVGATAPTSAREQLDASVWNSGGYVDENGLTMSISRSMTTIKDWAQSTVRNALSEYDGSLSLSWLQMDEWTASTVFGEDNVTATEATADAGASLKIAIGAQLPPIRSFCFSMKDGDARIRIYVPRGQVTEVGDVTFVPGSGNVYPSTIATYDDGTGHSMYVMYDDGVTISDNSSADPNA